MHFALEILYRRGLDDHQDLEDKTIINVIDKYRVFTLSIIILILSFYTQVLIAETVASASVYSVEDVGMTVSDLDSSVDFYSDVLGFTKVSEEEVWGEDYEHLQGIFGLRMRIARMKLGNEFIELTEYLTPKGRPIPPDSRSNDRWFQHIAIVVSNIDVAYKQLRKFNVQHASTAPQEIPRWNKAAAGIKAFYFKDPDGHNLEIIYFPKGKGDPKWQKTDNKLFLGIDHTAIVIWNTGDSLKFYRDILGLDAVGKSENYGTEQEHLNNVFGARLEITALRAVNGPGIEFLQYISPRDGRPVPIDQKTNDIASWQTTLAVKNLKVIERKLLNNGRLFISPGIVKLENYKLGFVKGLMVKDPDGHVMRIVELNQ